MREQEKKNYTMKKKNTIFHLLLVNGPIHGLISMSNGATEYNGYISKSHFDILLDVVLDFLASFIQSSLHILINIALNLTWILSRFNMLEITHTT